MVDGPKEENGDIIQIPEIFNQESQSIGVTLENYESQLTLFEN